MREKAKQYEKHYGESKFVNASVQGVLNYVDNHSKYHNVDDSVLHVSFGFTPPKKSGWIRLLFSIIYGKMCAQ